MGAIDKVRAKRKAVRSASTKFVNKVKSFLETFDNQNETHQEKLSEYLLNLDAKKIELQTLNKEVEDLLSDKELLEAEIEGSPEYEENINEVKYKIKIVEFHRQKDSKNIGDVRKLMKFIKFEIESRESANIALRLSLEIPESFRYPPRNVSYQRQPKFKHNFPSSSALTTVIKNVCIFCNSDTHTSIGCQIFSNEEKREKLKKEGRCYRCMIYKHLILQCKPLERTFEVVNLTLRSRFPPFQSINIEAIVTDEITGAEIYSDLTPKLLHNLIPFRCQMADTFQNGPIQILLGANFLVNTITGKPRKINKDLFMIPSLFGETQIGQLPYSRTVKKHAAAVYNLFCTGVENDLREINTFLLEDEASFKTGVSLRDFGKEIKKENGCCEVPPLRLKTNCMK
ncbi:UNVERIFIED_CONTAM: hypothetical protein NCL1_31766 [Trichonephila clavipes]